MKKVNNSIYDSQKNLAIDYTEKTIKIIKDKIIPQIQGIQAIVGITKSSNNLNNNFTFKNEIK